MTPGRDRTAPPRIGPAELALLAVVALWGWTFVAVRETTDAVPVLTFLALRFGIAAVAFLPLLVRGRSRSTPPLDGTAPDRSAPARPATATVGIAIGVVLALGYLLQTFGLRSVDPGRSGVITGISVTLVPFGAWLILRQRVGAPEWLGVFLAAVGFAFLGFGSSRLTFGDLLVLGCAVAFAAQVVALARFAPGRPVLPLAFAQVATAAVLFTVAAAVVEWPDGFPTIDRDAWKVLLLTGVGATTAGFAVQTWAQRSTSPTRIALILALEPVFALAAGRILVGEDIGGTTAIGAACIVAGMLCAELAPRRAG